MEKEHLSKQEFWKNKSKYLAALWASLALTLASCDQPKDWKIIKVHSWDTFFQILKKNGISPTTQNISIIKKTNHIKDINNIQVGQNIFLPKVTITSFSRIQIKNQTEQN